MDVAVFDIDVFENVVYLKQHLFNRDPKKLAKLSKANNIVNYEALSLALIPRYESIIERQINENLIRLSPKRQYGNTVNKRLK